MSKSLGIMVILIISIVILIGLVRQIADALESGSRLDRSTDEISILQERNRSLKKRLEEVETSQFVEEIARNKLNMSKPNETVVIIQKELVDNLIQSQKPKIEPVIPNWQAWLRLFFH